MEPTEKSPEIDSFITKLFGVDRQKTIRENKCISCGGDAMNFNDPKSLFEYRISGMCQKCQDDVFGYESCDGEAPMWDENGNSCDGHCDDCLNFEPKDF